MQEQYYFPTSIEELSIGMEVEIHFNNKWNKVKIDEDNLSDTFEGLSIRGCIEAKYLRIPYLTSKDIEDEGFKLIDEKEIYSPKFKTDTKNKDFSLGNSEYYYEMVKYNQSKNSISCEIHLTLIREEGSISLPLFNGTIKNKQDFKKLLIMLGIK